jgi:hypothetical protein
MLADQKANSLLGVLAVLNISILVTASLFIFLEGAALVLALLVIMPGTVGTRDSREISNIPNPAFFGFFNRVTESDYVRHLTGILCDHAFCEAFAG